MKLEEVFSWLNDLFDPSEVRRAKMLQKRWDELDDVAAIIGDKNVAHRLRETACIKEVVNRRSAS